MRESVFAILGDIRGCSFLDLFSGTGVVAAEAASRGAAAVVAVERNRANRALIERNVAFAADQVAVRIQACEAFVRRSARRQRWDYIFVDPPFAYRHVPELLSAIADGDLLAPTGRLLLHVPTPTSAPALMAAASPLVVVDQRRFGGSTLYQFALEEPRVGLA